MVKVIYPQVFLNKFQVLHCNFSGKKRLFYAILKLFVPQKSPNGGVTGIISGGE